MSLEEAVSVIRHHFIGKLYAKEVIVARGYKIGTHEHGDAHLSFLGSGHALVEVDGVKTEYTGPCMIEIEAGKRHEIIALTELRWWCVHANLTGETDAGKIDEVLIRRNDDAVR